MTWQTIIKEQGVRWITRQSRTARNDAVGIGFGDVAGGCRLAEGDGLKFKFPPVNHGMRPAQGYSGQFLSHCPYRGLGSVGDTDLAENMLSMLLDGLVADV